MKNISQKGFSIIEVLVSILIFALGITSIYMLISSTIKTNDYSKNQVIAANLAREGLELVRNIRDSNYKILKVWDLKNSALEDYSDNNKFLTGYIYKIENNYNPSTNFPIKVEKITNFGEGIAELNGKMKNYRLCLNSSGFYTYDCSEASGNKKTDFYRYIKIDELKSSEGIIDNALKITSKVIWYSRGYHQIEISTILTDWKRL